MERAFDALDDSPHNAAFPSEIYGWSGNTHWKCPRPDWDGDPEDNKDGYCGYAQSQAYRITAARSWLAGAEFDVFAGLVLKSPEGAVPYSSVLDYSVFDSGDTGWREGINWTERVHVTDPYSFEFTLGNPDAIPKNGIVPESKFDGDGNAVRRHSAKRGWTAKAYGFLDYGVEGGFKFQAKEV